MFGCQFFIAYNMVKKMPKIKYIKQNIFLILSILTIGFPFVGYKILAGIVINRLYGGFWGAELIAFFFIVWGLIDFFLNAVSLHAVSCRGNLHYPVCLLSIISKKHHILAKWKDSGEALDVMLSFIIVAFVVGQNLFIFMDGMQVKLWNLCTVVNVLGAGIARLSASILSSE